MSGPIRLGIENNYDPPNPLKPPYVEITDAIAAEIARRGLEHSRHGLPITPQTITMPPTKPPANQCQGDDAAIDKMADLIQSCDAGDCNNRVQVGSHDECYVLGRYTSRRIAPQIIAAIRRGEVPGITTADKHLAPWKEVAELRASLTAMTTLATKHKNERDKTQTALEDSRAAGWRLAGMRDAAEKEREQAQARVKELESDLAHVQSQKTVDLNDQAALEIEMAEAARDKALADLAAARESEERFRGEVVAAFRKHGMAAGPLAVDGLVRDLSAMKEQLEQSMLAAGETQDAFKRECAEHAVTKGALDAMKEQNVRLNAQVEVLLSKDGRNYCMRVEAERDAARAEVSALKARKVKLPERKPNEGYTRQGAINDTYNSALLDCEEAIRAAGITLDGE